MRYTTPWNQIEASLAFGFGIPIIVLMEPGLREEGLLEQKFDWYVDQVNISAAGLSDKNVRNRLMAWCRKLQTAKVSANRGTIDAKMALFSVQLLTLGSVGWLIAISFGIFVFGIAVGTESRGHLFVQQLVRKP